VVDQSGQPTGVKQVCYVLGTVIIAATISVAAGLVKMGRAFSERAKDLKSGIRG